MYKIYYLNDFNESLTDDNWKIKLDISTLWDKYENKELNYNEFVIKLNNFILSKKDKLDKESIIDFQKNIKNEIKNINEFYIYLDSIYDWGDKYDVNIYCKENNKNTDETSS